MALTSTVGSFPVALVIFAGIAIFLILRLRSVLGRRVGFEKPSPGLGQVPSFTADSILAGGRHTAAPPPGHPVPDPRSPLGTRLMQIVNLDASFDPPKFLSTAETAFRTIVTAFASGDRAALKPLLSTEVFATFEAAIATREAAGERHRTDIKAVISATIEDAQLVGDHAAIIVRFVSDQINLTLDSAGNPLVGTEAVTEIHDLWTFERNLKDKNPTWRLGAARNG
jgi:predicted lipid-binding transport protein (Tim44 family)